VKSPLPRAVPGEILTVAVLEKKSNNRVQWYVSASQVLISNTLVEALNAGKLKLYLTKYVRKRMYRKVYPLMKSKPELNWQNLVFGLRS